MKKLLLITLFSTVVLTINAQVNQTPTYQQYLQQKKVFDNGKLQDKAVINLLPQKLQQIETSNDEGQTNIDNMPIAGNTKLQLTFLENNNNGLDIYQSSPENMFVLKPDATFYSAMPTGNFKVVKPEIKAIPRK